MLENKNVTVAMSGGIDSAVAALLLSRDGANISGATMRLCQRLLPDGRDGADTDIADAKAICDKLGIEHRVYDFKNQFHDTVIKNFIDTYMNGGTPNPCIVCNKTIKFGLMLDEELKRGADYIATGHYARIEKDENGRYLIRKADDDKKDQTYMLWSLSQHQLSHTLFPLSSYSKSEIRDLAEESGFSIARKSDSQDICFVPDGDYASFIESKLGEKYPAGDYVDKDGNVLGKHKGMIHYTIGQRKGLGISMNKHVFVTAKDPVNNTVTLGDEPELFSDRVIIRGINLIPFDKLNSGARFDAKVRYSQKQSPAYVEQTGEDEITLVFDTPQRAPAKGQSAVLYDGDYLIGGGIIQSKILLSLFCF